jgi:hypothetical protein
MSTNVPKDTEEHAAVEGESAVPRSGNGAQTALEAMIRKRQMRAGEEPEPPQPDGKKSRKK